MNHLPQQLLVDVVRPALAAIGLPGVVSEKLVMGTAAKESGFQAIRQIGGGPAVSFWQIEPATLIDTWNRLPIEITQKASMLVPHSPASIYAHSTDILSVLPGDMYVGAAMCRCVYYMKPFRAPAILDMADAAYLWKTWYNGPQGAGTEDEFCAAWKAFGLDALWGG